MHIYSTAFNLDMNLAKRQVACPLQMASFTREVVQYHSSYECSSCLTMRAYLFHLIYSLSDNSLKHSAATMLQMQLITARIFHIFSPHFSYSCCLTCKPLFIG